MEPTSLEEATPEENNTEKWRKRKFYSHYLNLWSFALNPVCPFCERRCALLNFLFFCQLTPCQQKVQERHCREKWDLAAWTQAGFADSAGFCAALNFFSTQPQVASLVLSSYSTHSFFKTKCLQCTVAKPSPLPNCSVPLQAALQPSTHKMTPE